MADRSIGYMFHTGAGSSDRNQFQQLVTIDAPRRGDVIHSCVGRQGPYFLTQEFSYGRYNYYVHVLPTPGGTTDVKYENALKQEYKWKSKKYVMPGRTTFSVAKVVFDGGCCRLRIHVDGCCRYDQVVKSCAPFKLPDQLVGIDWEIEVAGTAVVSEIHIASTFQELARE